MDELSFVHMTDVHIQGEGDDLFLGIDTAANFKAAISHLQTIQVQPAFFAISGDLIQDAGEAGYVHFKKLLTELDSYKVPILLALGNHDERVAFQKVILGEKQTDESRRHYHSQTFNGIKAIILDSRESGSVHGTFDDVQMAWLKDELAEGLPSILIFHHPPVITPFALLDNHILEQESIDKLAAVIEGHKVLGILNGHIHFNNVAAFKGVPTFAGGHVAFTLDPYETDGMTFMNGSGFNIVTIKNDQMLLNPVTVPRALKTIHHLGKDQLTALQAEHGG